jgi:hypothetical protein
MDDTTGAEAHASANESLRPALPDGEYAIVEQLGHRTMIGRVAEVERFGAKLMQIEAIFDGQLLPPTFIGGGGIYAFTPVTIEVAAARAPKSRYQLPPALAALVPPTALPAPHEDDIDPPFAPAFLTGEPQE